MLVVGRPEVEAYSPVFVSRDRLVIITAGCAHPDVQDIVYGRKVGHQRTIRRNLRIRLDGVAEQDIAWNQGNGCRGSHAISAPLSNLAKVLRAIPQRQLPGQHCSRIHSALLGNPLACSWVLLIQTISRCSMMPVYLRPFLYPFVYFHLLFCHVWLFVHNLLLYLIGLPGI